MTRKKTRIPSNPLPADCAGHLRDLGVYGFDAYEAVILAALVTEDPLLLIGRSGTGKTFLLNSLSETLGLEHRHYNASLISFDDLVGFPYPQADGSGVTFLETPATVWSAQSVLVDEISRCKPEHQNRLFSLVHERRIQGIRLERLRFRWAAMNPCSTDQDGDDGYAGSEALDPALGDRFGLIVTAADWIEIDNADRRRIADPAGEGAPADDGGRLGAKLVEWREEFERTVAHCPPEIIDYASAAVTLLNQSLIRISPRRARFLTRSLLAAEIVAGRRDEALFALVLACTLPHASWGVRIDPLTVKVAHRGAWDLALGEDRRKWIQRFHIEPALDRKLAMLLDECRDPESGTQAICELLANTDPGRAAAFAFALYPAAAKGLDCISREGINELGKLATPILEVSGVVTWQESTGSGATTHPGIARYAKVINRRRGARQARARQFFHYVLLSSFVLDDPAATESELDACVQVMKAHLQKARAA